MRTLGERRDGGVVVAVEDRRGMRDDRTMDRRTRGLFLVGALLYVAGTGLNLLGQFGDIRWALIVAIVLWVVGVGVVLVAATRYVSGRRKQ